jgi:hypothetical protein
VRWARTTDRRTLALAAVVAGQALWLGVLAAQGWYYQADFSNLAEPTGHSLSWSYLTLSQGGHLGIAGRAVFWVLNRLAPLNYAATILLRILVQAVSTVLLARLLTLLVGRRRGVLVITALYAMSPLLIQGTLWLTSSVGLLSSQLLLLIALDAHVRYTVRGSLKWAVTTAAGVFGATVCSEQAAVTALILPILSAGFLHAGTARERCRAMLHRWPGWLMIIGPVIGFVAYFFTVGNYSQAVHGLGAYDVVRLVTVEWFASVIPGLLGGPWVWDAVGDNYLSVANPALGLRIGCAVVFAVVVIAGVRRVGRVALAAWSMPLLVSAVGIVVVGLGRFEGLGLLVANLFEHSYYAALPAALAAALAWWRIDPVDIAGRVHHAAPADRPAPQVGRRAPTAALVTVVAAGSIVSGLTYTARWADSPAHAYVTRLTADVRHLGRTAAVYDSPAASTVIPGIEPAHDVSDILGLAGSSTTTDIVVGPRPVMAGPDGGLRPAGFFASAHGVGDGRSACNQLVQGEGTWRLRLDRPLTRSGYYLRLNFFQQRLSTLEFEVIGADGRSVRPLAGERTAMSINLGSIALKLPTTAPREIVVRSASRATNICIVKAEIGFPFAAAR